MVNRYKYSLNKIKLKNIEKNTIGLKNQLKSDKKRWKDNNQLFIDWNERTAILGDLILPNSNIIEFGAGNMFLKNYLTNYQSYTPSDIVKRYSETLECDLNNSILIDLTKFDTVVLSGVLEYVYNVDDVIKQLSENYINQIVLSYSCSDIIEVSRVKNGWLSDYNKLQLEEIFKNNNYKIEFYTEWRRQSLYNLILEKNN